MRVIEKLSEMIEEELDDAEKYARCALNHKEDDKALADVFCRLAEEELGHMNMLHAQVVAKIDAYRKANGDPPEKMLALYDYLHKKHIQHTAEVKVMLGMYKGER